MAWDLLYALTGQSKSKPSPPIGRDFAPRRTQPAPPQHAAPSAEGLAALEAAAARSGPQAAASNGAEGTSAGVDAPIGARFYRSEEISGSWALAPRGVSRSLPDAAETAAIGSITSHGSKWDSKGKHTEINQDRGCVVTPFAGDETALLACVFDGHGPQGEQVSEYIVAEVPKLLEESLLERAKAAGLSSTALLSDEAVEAALSHAFVTADINLRESKVPSYKSGTTAVVALVRAGRIHTANAGDSRAVIGQSSKRGASGVRAVALTEDQKPDSPDEMARLRAAGATVTAASKFGPGRVWSSPTGGCGLAMSRSIGDDIFTRIGVCATPVTSSCALLPSHKWLVLASDGVWEFLETERVVTLVELHEHASDSAMQLVQLAARAWAVEEGDDYRDDITAVVLQIPLLFPPRPPPSPPTTPQATATPAVNAAAAAAAAKGKQTAGCDDDGGAIERLTQSLPGKLELMRKEEERQRASDPEGGSEGGGSDMSVSTSTTSSSDATQATQLSDRRTELQLSDRELSFEQPCGRQASGELSSSTPATAPAAPSTPAAAHSSPAGKAAPRSKLSRTATLTATQFVTAAPPGPSSAPPASLKPSSRVTSELKNEVRAALKRVDQPRRMGSRMTPRASSATRSRPGSAGTEVAVASPPVAGHPALASRRLTLETSPKATSDVGCGTSR